MPDTSNVVILAGMHRSGTSLLANYLHHSGINMGKELVGPARGNKFGHFEDVAIVDFHKEIIQREYDSHMWVEQRPRTTEQDIIRAKSLIENKSSDEEVWGWKDPRTSLFLELWLEVLPEARFIFLYRNPINVIDSIIRRSGTSKYDIRRINKLYKSYIVYNNSCLEFYHKYKNQARFIAVESLTCNRITKLSKFLETELDCETFNSIHDKKEYQNKASFHLAWPPNKKAALELFNQIQKLEVG